MGKPPHAGQLGVNRFFRRCFNACFSSWIFGWHQQEPILRRGAPDVLEEGMVLAIEPRKDAWHVQDMILVQQGAPVLLSAKLGTDEVFVVRV